MSEKETSESSNCCSGCGQCDTTSFVNPSSNDVGMTAPCKTTDDKGLLGDSIASKAICEMEKEAAQERQKAAKREACDLDSEVKAFLKRCEDANRNPLDVVSHIAKNAHIDLDGKKPEDGDTYLLWKLLRKVIVAWTADTLGWLTSNICGINCKSLISSVLTYVANRFSFVRDIDFVTTCRRDIKTHGEVACNEEVEHQEYPVIKGFGFGYAFTW